MKHEITSLNTKKALAESLKTIMRTKSFSKITVSEIITNCGVNRKTFYYHFEDIYALLKWTLEYEAVDIVKQFDLTVDHAEAITFVMNYVEQNDHLLNCAYDSLGRDGLKIFFYADFKEMMETIIETFEQEFHTQLEENYKAFLTEFYVGALSEILIDWIRNIDVRDRSTTITYIVETVKDSLRGIFKNYCPSIVTKHSKSQETP